MANEWTHLSSNDQGSLGQPGSQYTILKATVETNSKRFRLLIKDRWGSNQGYLQEHGENDRQYRADSLDELMRISLSAERDRMSMNGTVGAKQEILTAIREAIYSAEDVA